jgi:hypothetical protein
MLEVIPSLQLLLQLVQLFLSLLLVFSLLLTKCIDLLERLSVL